MNVEIKAKNKKTNTIWQNAIKHQKAEHKIITWQQATSQTHAELSQ